jgi:hypothetical protein
LIWINESARSGFFKNILGIFGGKPEGKEIQDHTALCQRPGTADFLSRAKIA